MNKLTKGNLAANETQGQTEADRLQYDIEDVEPEKDDNPGNSLSMSAYRFVKFESAKCNFEDFAAFSRI